MPDPHGDTGVVEDLPDVVGVHSVDDEGDRSPTLDHVGRADDPGPGALGETGEQPLGEHLLVRVDPIHPQVGEVVARRCEPDGLARS